MKHTSMIGVLVLASILGCDAKPQTSPQPPRIGEQRALGRYFDPTPESLKSNPRPAEWMIGCFSVIQPALTEAEQRPVPRVVELTNIPYTDDGVHQRYRVRSLDPRFASEGWAWKPVTTTTVELMFTDGFSGWRLNLEPTSVGMSGTATSFSDVPVGGRVANIELLRNACAPAVPPN